jgi:lysozyme
MPGRRDPERSVMKELQRVTTLIEDEVVPRLHEPSDDGRPGTPDSPETTDGQPVPRGARRALERLYTELSHPSASALGALFSRVEGQLDTEPEADESESHPHDSERSDGADGAPAKGTTVLSRTASGLGARAAAGGIPTQAGVRIGPVGRLLVQILTRYPRRRELAISSGFRPGPRSHHRGLIYKGSPTAAVDVVAPGAAKMRDVANWLYRSFADDTVELIHTTPFASDRGFYVKDQRRYPGGGPYSSQTRREHRNHVHFACSKALALKILRRLAPPTREPEAVAPASTRARRRRVALVPRRARRLSKRGAQLIAEFEGLRPRLYNDPAGHCTIGIGHLVHRGRCNGNEPGEFKRGITRDRAYQLLQRDAARMEAAVNRLGVPLNQNQFDALVSFTYNLGPGWTMENNGLRNALRARRYRDVPREMNKWVRAGGKVLPGLVRRRKAEGRLFASGGAPAPPPGVIRTADVQPGKNNGSVLVVQKALAKAVGLDFSSGPGNFGPRTTRAYAAWQRNCGIAANGRPEFKSLKTLGDKYGFKVGGAPAPRATPQPPAVVSGHSVATA